MESSTTKSEPEDYPRQSYIKQWYYDNIERERDKRRISAAKFRKENPRQQLFNGAKARAKLKGIPFSITIDDISIPDVCPILNEPLVRGTQFAPSLDRWDCSLGYIKGNVWVISRKANVMKNNATEKELKEFAKWIHQTFQPS